MRGLSLEFRVEGLGFRVVWVCGWSEGLAISGALV